MKINEYIRQIISNEIDVLEKLSSAIDLESKNLESKFSSSSTIQTISSKNEVLTLFVARGNSVLDKELRQILKEYINFINSMKELNHWERENKNDLQKNLEIKTSQVKEKIRIRLEDISMITF
jgi:hypothetical protein